MFLSVRWLGFELLSVTFERDDAVELDPACIACEDSGDPCAVCGTEEIEVES